MLRVLYNIEKELPKLLLDSAGWNSLDVDYHPPRVERVWRQLDEFRIMLHRIHPCDNALLHPHPWPSAVCIVSGSYEMGLGYNDLPIPPTLICKMIAGPGSRYEMIEKFGWHYVKPLQLVYSVMVIGKPWADQIMVEETKKAANLRPLSEHSKRDIIDYFRVQYNIKTLSKK